MASMREVRRPTEGIRHEQPNTSLCLKTQNLGTGTLYITESFVIWVTEGEKGMTLSYLNICLHAICRDTNVFPEECLYVHTDADIPGIQQEPGDNDDSGSEENSFPPIIELFFVPADKESLNSMYQSMVSCQALHPDPADDFSPDEDFFEQDEDELMEDADSQLADLRITNNGHNHDGDEIEYDVDCFEDALDD